MKKFFLFAFAAILLAGCNSSTSLEGISLNKSSITLEVGESYTLIVLYEPESAEKVAPDILWESSRENVAVVKKGKVFAQEAGKTTITAHCGKLEAQCEVEVTGEGVDPEIPTEKILSGKFTVADGKKVRFASGNLQYKPTTDTWRFAENQYDIIGDENSFIKLTTNCDYWLDLFGWGTAKEPFKWSASETYNFTDWGVNPIANGGNKAYAWRTPTQEEFEYLLGRENAVTVARIEYASGYYRNGYLLFPDDWSAPEGITISFSIWEDYNYNSFSIGDWKKMESAGAVFFPEAGERVDTRVTADRCSYWTSTPGIYHYNAYFFYGRGTNDNPHRECGLAVRLVQDVE